MRNGKPHCSRYRMIIPLPVPSRARAKGWKELHCLNDPTLGPLFLLPKFVRRRNCKTTIFSFFIFSPFFLRFLLGEERGEISTSVPPPFFGRGYASSGQHFSLPRTRRELASLTKKPRPPPFFHEHLIKRKCDRAARSLFFLTSSETSALAAWNYGKWRHFPPSFFPPVQSSKYSPIRRRTHNILLSFLLFPLFPQPSRRFNTVWVGMDIRKTRSAAFPPPLLVFRRRTFSDRPGNLCPAGPSPVTKNVRESSG